MLKNISKNKWTLILVIVGFFMLMFDQNISLGGLSIYPEYQTSGAYSLEFQLYSLNYVYGAWCEIDEIFVGDIMYQLTIDIVPDVIGFLLLAIGLKKMTGFSRLFGIASAMSWFAVLFYAFIRVMPFIFNGMPLSYMCFWLSIAMYGIEVIIGYIFVCGVCDTLSGFEHRQSRKAIVICWFAMVVLLAVVCVLRWIAVISPGLVVTYQMILLGVSMLFYYFIYRDSDFIVKDKTLKYDDVEGLLCRKKD